MVEQVLGGLFGAQDDDDDDRRRGRVQDFVSRYEQGPPYEGISGEEAFHNYRRVADRLPPEEYEEAAFEAFQRMSPRDRAQFAEMMRQRGGFGGGDFQMDDPRELARITSRFQRERGGDLASLFGFGGGGGEMGDLLGATRGDRRRGDGGNDLGDMLNNPLAKAALGGIAAMAMKRMFR